MGRTVWGFCRLYRVHCSIEVRLDFVWKAGEGYEESGLLVLAVLSCWMLPSSGHRTGEGVLPAAGAGLPQRNLSEPGFRQVEIPWAGALRGYVQQIALLICFRVFGAIADFVDYSQELQDHQRQRLDK